MTRLSRYLTLYNQRSDQFSRWRLFLFLGGIVATLAALAFSQTLALIVTLVWLAAFVVLVRRHQRVLLTLAQFRIWRQIKQTHIARMRLDWDNLPISDADAPPDHPFARDIDIIGEYSLHRLLDTTVSRGGSARLLSWLLSPQPETVSRRQALVRELIPLSMFRERITLAARLAAGERQTRWDGDVLLRWLNAEEDEAPISGQMLTVLLLLSALTLGLGLFSLVTGAPALWVGAWIAFLLLSANPRRNLGELFDEALRLQAQVARLSAVFAYLERYSYQRTPALEALCAPFKENAPSQQLRRIGRITSGVSLQRNVLLWLVINFFFPWDVLFAYWLSRSKGDLAALLPGWLETWYDLEALSSLATFADLNPRYTFPVIASGAVMEAAHIGHPLIPEEAKVRNDFALDSLGQVVIITGSNMSGKSSFLRTLGVNLVLAYAGSVTDAQTLTIGLLRLFTSIRVTDSVVDGISYFYAEVRRLKALLAALHDADDTPLFFLIDEIFRGTNNLERLVGSRSYIKALVGGNGVGLISTHDLELVRLADEIPQISNMHFREDIAEGRMAFDYRLRGGPSPTTNALKIMAMEGLPVDTA